MLNLLEEGTTSLNSIQLAEAQERLGADHRHRRQPRPYRGDADRADPQSGAVARPARRRRPQPRLRRRPRSSASRQQQLAGIAAEMTQPSGIAARALPAVLYGAAASLWEAGHRHRRSRGGARAHPRRAGPLPPDLDPARQCDDLRGQRSSARPARAAARSAVRQLAAACRAARGQAVRRARAGGARRGSC